MMIKNHLKTIGLFSGSIFRAISTTLWGQVSAAGCQDFFFIATGHVHRHLMVEKPRKNGCSEPTLMGKPMNNILMKHICSTIPGNRKYPPVNVNSLRT